MAAQDSKTSTELPATITPRNYHRPADEAKRLGVCQRTLATWISEKRIPVFRIGRCLLLAPDQVDAALAARFRVAYAGEPRPPKRRATRIAPHTAAD